ncbi:MAG: DEAD/DEAH box helicase [Gammaproteobacteria bacterium]|nr:DEAD/DEAH box helicase [Gammaproteobacteria bacterium]
MTDNTTITFQSLGLPKELIPGIEKAGFETCTAIQAQTLPIVLAGHDVAGQAQTGTGKTAAFLLATFNRLLTDPLPPERKRSGPRAVLLAPTRELAIQIHADALVLGCGTEFKMAVVFGGKDYEKQRETLRQGVDILIGTPGRFIDYFKQKIFSLRDAQVMVLDEADRMFDLGFIKDIRYILRRLPPADQRLNLLFSATLSQRVIELAYEHMNEPEVVRIEPEKMTVDRVTQTLYFPGNDEKIPLLIGLMRTMNATRTMVFVNMKREADRIARYLQHNGIGARAISGDVPQNKRMKMLEDFQAGTLPVLVATDVASRGLHVNDVSHVVNYDLPNDPEDYVHRIGRTARAGASGDALSFACETYAQSLPDIEAYIGHRIPTASIDHDNLPEIKIPPRPPRKPGGPGGRGRPKRNSNQRRR